MPICTYCGKFTDHSAPGERCASIHHPKNRAAWRARVLEEERREKAERIADQIMEDMTGTESLHWIAATAAYAALAKMESAR